MEQRPLRLGDIVDDYCPRERRLTNHAIVALVDDTIKQTRCTTCDHEHVYKHAREPKRRKKDAAAELYTQVLSGLQKPAGQPLPQEGESVSERENDDTAVEAAAAAPETTAPPPAAAAAPHAAPAGTDDTAAGRDDAAAGAGEVAAGPSEIPGENGQAHEDEHADGNRDDGDEPWPMHRRLIRAQLPRTGNEPPPARPLPEFTVRQPGARGGQRQWGRGGAGGGANGHHGRGGQGQGGGHGRQGRGRGFTPPRADGRGGQGGGRPGGGRGRRSR